MLKGYFDDLLDRQLGGGKTPNLPTRLVFCLNCKRVRHIAKLQNCDLHRQKLESETWINYLKSLL